jgi:adenosylcobinamide-GDP ribazoletransferase
MPDPLLSDAAPEPTDPLPRWQQGLTWISPRRLAAALAFYTCLPIPGIATLDVSLVARSAPAAGLGIGALLVGLDQGLNGIQAPLLTRSVLVVLAWLAITGGLHLDGAMDTADGLSVQDPDRRLQVMADSVTGAFGAMTAIALLLLKVAAVAELMQGRIWTLLLVPAWARWGQQVAIARYPYLKAEGKGAFHKQALPSLIYVWPWAILLGGLSILSGGVALGLAAGLWNEIWLGPGVMRLGCGAIALAVAVWFGQKLGGHTGDSYGAVVEWSEALSLIWLVLCP